jgi:hypothetical protein
MLSARTPFTLIFILFTSLQNLEKLKIKGHFGKTIPECETLFCRDASGGQLVLATNFNRSFISSTQKI